MEPPRQELKHLLKLGIKKASYPPKLISFCHLHYLSVR
jgi:hypothetical protein